MDSAASNTAHVQEWAGGIWQVKVPLPFSLKWVNSYLLPDAKGYTLIDPGLHTADSLQVWEQALQKLGVHMQQIHTIVLTHQHPDHFGLAGWFQARTGAPVYMSSAAHAYTQRLWGEHRSFAQELTAHYEEHGMPAALQQDIREHLESFLARVTPMPQVTLIAPGDIIPVGGGSWLAIDAPGHAFGQLCFYEKEQKLMLCGDQVLPDITPNISLVPGEEADPLASFLSSLAELADYEVEWAFPGHRDPFADFSGRIQALIAFHGRRLAQMHALLQERPRSGYEMCEALFGARIAGNAHNLRFAMSETLAHLVHLERKGEARRIAQEDLYIFEAL